MNPKSINRYRRIHPRYCHPSAPTKPPTIPPATTPQRARVGFQALFGLHIGCGQQQAVLKDKNVPTGLVIKFFGQSGGGAVFVGGALNGLNSRLAGTPALVVEMCDGAEGPTVMLEKWFGKGVGGSVMGR